MTKTRQSGSTRVAVPWQVASARRNRKVAKYAISVASIFAFATVGLLQPLLLVSKPQAADVYQPSLADITKANAQSLNKDVVATIKIDEPQYAPRGGDLEVKLEPLPAPTRAASAGASRGASGSHNAVAPVAPAATGTIKGDAQAYLESKGFTGEQWACFDRLIQKESGWNPSARNSSSGAYGLPQSLPGSKMASMGADWETNPITQVAWGLNYMVGRYGSPCGAYSHSQRNGWY